MTAMRGPMIVPPFVVIFEGRVAGRGKEGRSSFFEKK
jgi:hypothetical protein